MVTTSCPSRDTLLQFSIGMLTDQQSDELAGHLDSCPDCQATILTLEDAEDTLIGRLRTPSGGESYSAEPEFQAAVAEAIAKPAGKGDSPHFPERPFGCFAQMGTVPFSSPDIPPSLGEYQILEELGRGGMGRVYKALHTKLDRVVALKVLPRGRVGDQKSIARFEREMKAVGRLVHPNIVQAYDAREIDGTPVLIMEFVDGLDLAEIVRRLGAGKGDRHLLCEAPFGPFRQKVPVPFSSPVPVADACELMRQTAVALQCAHEHGLVHRDIKPSNIMLVRSGEVKLLDLGLARFYAEGGAASSGPLSLRERVRVSAGDAHQPALSADSPEALTPGPSPSGRGELTDMTGAGQAMGTADYMAPEQASDSRSVDIRADLYSLGCTLYKLLSGRAPFSGPEYRTTLDKLNAHVHQPAPPIRQLVPEVPEKLAAILDRLLAKDPADRFSTPAEVAEALAPWCGDADLPALLQRALSSPLPPGEGEGEGELSPLPPGEGQGEGRPAPLLLHSWGWKWFTGQLILLLMAGGLGFALGVITIRIHKDGQTTTIQVPEGSHTHISPEGQVDVDLAGRAKHASLNEKATQDAWPKWRIAEVTGELAAQKALLKGVDETPLSPAELDALVANDPIAKQLFLELGWRKRDSVYPDHPPGGGAKAERFRKDLQIMQKQYDQRLGELRKKARENNRSHIAKEITKLEAELASLQEQHKAGPESGQGPISPTLGPTREPQEAPLQFGPVIERVVNSISEGKGGDGLDLATGKLVDVPKEFGKLSAQQQNKWSTENNVDLLVGFLNHDGMGGMGGMAGGDAALMPQALKLAAIDGERWDNALAQDLQSALASITPERLRVSPDGSYVATAQVSRTTRRHVLRTPVPTATDLCLPDPQGRSRHPASDPLHRGTARHEDSLQAGKTGDQPGGRTEGPARAVEGCTRRDRKSCRRVVAGRLGYFEPEQSRRNRFRESVHGSYRDDGRAIRVVPL